MNEDSDDLTGALEAAGVASRSVILLPTTGPMTRTMMTMTMSNYDADILLGDTITEAGIVAQPSVKPQPATEAA